MIHIANVEYALLLSILSLSKNPFYAFGSRVKGTQEKYSDLDICYIEPLSSKVLYTIKEMLEDSNLTFRVDIVDFHSASDTFQKLIKDDLVKLPRVVIKQPCSQEEWILYHDIRIKAVFSMTPSVAYEPSHPVFSENNHHHFIFYLDNQPLGILYIEITSTHSAIIRNVTLNTKDKTSLYGAALIHLVHRWLQELKIHHVNLQCQPETNVFFGELGYSEMQFQNKQPGLSQNIEMGRYLHIS